MGGSCPYGDRCDFLHPEGKTRADDVTTPENTGSLTLSASGQSGNAFWFFHDSASIWGKIENQATFSEDSPPLDFPPLDFPPSGSLDSASKRSQMGIMARAAWIASTAQVPHEEEPDPVLQEQLASVLWDAEKERASVDKKMIQFALSEGSEIPCHGTLSGQILRLQLHYQTEKKWKDGFMMGALQQGVTVNYEAAEGATVSYRMKTDREKADKDQQSLALLLVQMFLYFSEAGRDDEDLSIFAASTWKDVEDAGKHLFIRPDWEGAPDHFLYVAQKIYLFLYKPDPSDCHVQLESILADCVGLQLIQQEDSSSYLSGAMKSMNTVNRPKS
ncbi:zinc finger CCCH domain-containing protein [Sansalvadorimonas verongulae]|uniref:zinc finger CCCH domain-containing protein n=1 Tax=Sansalvadorimonas verongulae TaxID=2172824 RepID=UPI0018AD2A72|nr:zinc finger CCCH domain-containing protein [Sansalvadorimonas verongulae]